MDAGPEPKTRRMAHGRDLPPELGRGPFTTAQAARLGVSGDVLAGQRFRRLHRGVYVRADVPDTIPLRVDAVRLLVPSAVASHHTAAILRSLPAPPETRVHITVPDLATHPRIAGVRSHVAPVRGAVSLVDGRPVLSVPRTLADLAAVGVGLVDLVTFGDAGVRRGWTTADHLVAATGSTAGRGCRVARRAAGLVRPRVDSPMETRLRLLLVLAGLPEPVTGRTVYDETGWVATPDLVYPHHRIAIEYDGDHHRTERRQWRHDKVRCRRLRDLGWELLECTADDVLYYPLRTLDWVHERLRRARHPEVPVRLGDAWREHWDQVRG